MITMITRQKLTQMLEQGPAALPQLISLLQELDVVVADSDPADDPVGTHRRHGDDEFVKVRRDWWILLSESDSSAVRWYDTLVEYAPRVLPKLRDIVDGTGDTWYEVSPGRFLCRSTREEAEADAAGASGFTLSQIESHWGLK
jgi:hypothetical protein